MVQVTGKIFRLGIIDLPNCSVLSSIKVISGFPKTIRLIWYMMLKKAIPMKQGQKPDNQVLAIRYAGFQYGDFA